jgi:hypothetical protein
MTISDADRYALLQQNYQDLAAGVRMIRDAVETAFGALPSGTGMTMIEGCEAIARAIYAAAEQSRSAPPPDADSKTRTRFVHRIDKWGDDGESVLEHLAGVEDFNVALATYAAACDRWAGAAITLRQGDCVIKDSRRTRLASR